MDQIIGKAAIEKFIPHRGDALFVSEARIEEKSVHGSASWSADHPVLRGHFPQQPIVPGVFLVEAAAQLAGVWIATHHGTNGIGMLAAVRRALIHSPVFADKTIQFALTVGGNAQGMFTVNGKGQLADGTKACTLDLLIAVKQ